MLTGFRHLHSTLAIVLLLALVVAIGITLVNYFKSNPYNRKIALIGFISAHLQLLIGIVFFFSLGYHNMFSSAVMKDPILRLKMVEHPLMMLIAIVLISVGYIKAKKMTESFRANKTVAIFYIIGLILILARIPWGSWSIFA